MPTKVKPPPPRRSRLTLGQLASYDDLLTDALVDNAYYWCTIRKNRSKYTPCRRFKKDEIRSIIFQDVICDKDLKKAEQRFAQLPGIQNFMRSLKTDGEREHFKRHMRKYMSIWLPDCAWEVGTTNRYTILTHEAAAFARRDIKKGELIKHLCGTLVIMTAEEEKDLDVTRRDFSIVRSSRRKASALFLGPARFSNHDCNASAALITTGSDGMNVVAVRNIAAGDEITVTYGEDYFGIDNCECLCHTCELKGRNGWAGGEGGQGEQEEEPVVDDYSHYSLRNRRKRSFETASSSGCPTPDVEVQTPRKRTKTATPSTPETHAAELPTGDHQTPSRTVRNVYGRRPNLGRRRSLRSSLYKESDRTWDAEAEAAHDTQGSPLKNEVANAGEAIDMSRVASSQTSHEISDVDLVFDRHDEEQPQQAATPLSMHSDEPEQRAAAAIEDTKEVGVAEELELVASEKDEVQIQVKQEGSEHVDGEQHEAVVTDDLGEEIRDSLEKAPSEQQTPVPEGTTTLEEAVAEIASHNPAVVEASLKQEHVDASSDLSDIASDEEFDEKRMTVVKRMEPPRRRGPGRPPGKGRPSTPVVIPSIEEPKGSRRPGDYERTRELLAQPGSIWADCHTCDGTWVQLDAHETHRECPRCERHSIMFGYPWPKTEQEFGDPERVRDHRTINRILGPGEQRSLKRRGRGLDGTPRLSTSREDSRRASTGLVDELKVVADGRRRSARRSYS